VKGDGLKGLIRKDSTSSVSSTDAVTSPSSPGGKDIYRKKPEQPTASTHASNSAKREISTPVAAKIDIPVQAKRPGKAGPKTTGESTTFTPEEIAGFDKNPKASPGRTPSESDFKASDENQAAIQALLDSDANEAAMKAKKAIADNEAVALKLQAQGSTKNLRPHPANGQVTGEMTPSTKNLLETLKKQDDAALASRKAADEAATAAWREQNGVASSIPTPTTKPGAVRNPNPLGHGRQGEVPLSPPPRNLFGKEQPAAPSTVGASPRPKPAVNHPQTERQEFLAKNKKFTARPTYKQLGPGFRPHRKAAVHPKRLQIETPASSSNSLKRMESSQMDPAQTKMNGIGRTDPLCKRSIFKGACGMPPKATSKGKLETTKANVDKIGAPSARLSKKGAVKTKNTPVVKKASKTAPAKKRASKKTKANTKPMAMEEAAKPKKISKKPESKSNKASEKPKDRKSKAEKPEAKKQKAEKSEQKQDKKAGDAKEGNSKGKKADE
jgi:hypothetical protein